MNAMERKETVMDILDAWLLHTSKVKYANVFVLGEDHVSSDDKDIIGLHFEMSMLDVDDYWNGMMGELIEIIEECYYGIEWYNSVEMHIYPLDEEPTDGWERYYDLVRYHHL